MLQRTSSRLSTPLELTGKTVAHTHRWTDAQRANLAARATIGAVVVAPLTALQAAEVFGIPAAAVAAELKRLGLARSYIKNNNGNGHAAPPAWESLSSEQRAEFLKANFDAIFGELELRTTEGAVR